MAHRFNGSGTHDGRSIGQLISDLLRQGSELLQEEMALARSEMSVKLPVAGRSLGMILGGGLLAYAAVLSLMATAIIALHYVLPWWASALLVTVIVLAISYVLIQSGIESLKRTSLVPRRTLASLKGYQDINRPAASSAFTRHTEGGY